MSRNAAPINTLIKTITQHSASQRANIQAALIEVALFAFEDRNIDPAIRLFAAVGGETYKAGMSKWLNLDAPIHFANDKVLLSSERQAEMLNTQTAAEYEATLLSMPAWFEIDAANNKTPNIWDGPKALESAVEYLAKLAKKAEKNVDPIAAEKLEAARMVLAKFLNDSTYDVVES